MPNIFTVPADEPAAVAVYFRSSGILFHSNRFFPLHTVSPLPLQFLYNKRLTVLFTAVNESYP